MPENVPPKRKQTLYLSGISVQSRAREGESTRQSVEGYGSQAFQKILTMQENSAWRVPRMVGPGVLWANSVKTLSSEEIPSKFRAAQPLDTPFAL